MNHDFKRTFDAVKLSNQRQEQIKAELSSRLSKKNKEDYIVNKTGFFVKKSRVLIVALVAVLAFSLVGFAYGSQVIQFLNGGRIEQGQTDDGGSFVSFSAGTDTKIVKVENGQIYFILDGSNKNITAQCSQSTYYKYEMTDNNGYRHVVVVGGTADNVGMAEFVWDENGKAAGSNARYNTKEEPEWLKSAMAEFSAK